MDNHEAFLSRLREAILDGDAKQVRIAEYCDVSEQAVARWKKHGQISKDNLLALSEITGFRYLYIKDGALPKRLESIDKNRNDYLVAENAKVYFASATSTQDNDEKLERLIDSVRSAYANKTLSDHSITLLSDFIRSLNNKS